MSRVDQFFANMPATDDFESFSDRARYKPLPDGWDVVLTDVVNSTAAIEEARYREVNLLGAASIVTAQQTCGRLPFPYSFGGDGAVLAVPRNVATLVTEALQRLSTFARERFDLELRVGRVPIEAVRDARKDVNVCKYRLPSGIDLALFQGGGVELCESLVKATQSNYRLPPLEGAVASLGALSCPVQPLTSRNGAIVSLLVRCGEFSTYGTFFDTIQSEIGGSIASVHPLRPDDLKPSLPAQSASDDARLAGGGIAKLIRRGKSLAGYSAMAAGLGGPLFRTMCAHSDNHKFDDVLRLVLDLSPEQRAKVSDTCDAMRQQGLLRYGLHVADHALVTCVIRGPLRGQHLHFIDGGAGGFSVAARQMKALDSAA